jgi:hypothetical protein
MVFQSRGFTTLNEGKINTQWQEIMTVSQFRDFTSAFRHGSRSRSYLWCYCCICVYVSNAELALMFIPVPISKNILSQV